MEWLLRGSQVVRLTLKIASELEDWKVVTLGSPVWTKARFGPLLLG